MKLLLDTCSFLWMISDSEKLSDLAKRVIQDPENEIFLSAVSAWEIQIQIQLKRLKITGHTGEFIKEQRLFNNILSLPIDEESVAHLQTLPLLHKDPFDRMLVAQSIYHGMQLITPDKMLLKYPARILW